MENASKALVMAGGVLIAIMVLATLMYMMQNTASYKTQTEEQQKIEQIAKFNKEYESYNKSLLRGTEVVTLINKAIANNAKYEEQDEIYDVDVWFKLLTPIKTTTVTVTNGVKGKARSKEEFAAGGIYKLKNNKEPDRINSQIKNFINVGAIHASQEYTIISYSDINNYTMQYNEFTDFKRRIFKCTGLEKSDNGVGIKYNDTTGRVCRLEFVEVKITENMEDYY